MVQNVGLVVGVGLRARDAASAIEGKNGRKIAKMLVRDLWLVVRCILNTLFFFPIPFTVGVVSVLLSVGESIDVVLDQGQRAFGVGKGARGIGALACKHVAGAVGLVPDRTAGVLVGVWDYGTAVGEELQLVGKLEICCAC